MTEIVYQQIQPCDIEGVVALQAACFPPPFPAEQLWQSSHIARHIEIFPQGQFVALDGKRVIGSASALLISEERWNKHLSWEQSLGGYYFESYDPQGTTLYGADISVHPGYRKRGIGKGLYTCRFDAVATLGLVRYGTACRIPGYAAWKKITGGSQKTYCDAVVADSVQDRTLTPLLKFGLTYCGIVENYMDDQESENSAALLEWRPR